MDWDDLFSDAPARADRSFRRKRDDDFYLVGARLGYGEGRAKFPLAFVQGQKFDLHLNRLTAHVADVKDFDRLPTPFRAVATDIETGRQVTLGSGSLPLAIRASMAVPGAFRPVEIDGRLLVDGLIADNVPVTVARKMGADVVIVVDVSDRLQTREEMKSLGAIVNQLTIILGKRNVEEQLATLTPRDIYLRPELGNLAASDFERVAEGIVIGERTARQTAEALQRLSVSEDQYARYRARHVGKTAPPVIDFIRVVNRSRLADELIRSRVTIKEGEPLDTARLEQDIGFIYGLDVFETVRYEIVREEGKTGLVIHATEKSWGPNYLQFGLELADNFEGDNFYNFGISYLRTAINPLNGEVRLALQIGQEPGGFAEWHQPLDPLSRYFTSAQILAGRQNFSVFNDDGDVIADYRVRRTGFDLAFGREFGTWGEGRVGYRRHSGEAEVRVGDPGLEDYEFDLAQLYLRLSLDEFDNLYFPSEGNRGVVEYAAAGEGYGSDNDFDQLHFRYAHAFPWGRNTLAAGLNYDTTLDGEAPIESQFRAGGFLRLSGFNPNELNGQHYGQITLLYHRRLTEMQVLPTYAGFSLEYGNVWQDEDDISLGDGIWNGSVFLGAWSILGPLYVGLGSAEGGRYTAFLYLGPVF
jgi:NTE family protein